MQSLTDLKLQSLGTREGVQRSFNQELRKNHQEMGNNYGQGELLTKSDTRRLSDGKQTKRFRRKIFLLLAIIQRNLRLHCCTIVSRWSIRFVRVWAEL